MIDAKELPLEYQVFALSFKQEGAIDHFAKELSVEEIASINENAGLKEFYQSLLDFYDLTGQPQIDPIAFCSWLESSRTTYAAIDALVGIQTFMDTVLSIDTSTAEEVTAVLKDRYKTRKQLTFVQELQQMVQSKEHKTEADEEKINNLTQKIVELQNKVNYDPLSKVKTANQILDSIDDIFTIPPFLSTPFKSLNSALGYKSSSGMIRGCVTGVVANSGLGKSTFVKALAKHWLDDGHSVLYINYEEAEDHWNRILLTQVLKENVYKLADIWTDKEKEERMSIFADKMHEWGDRLLVQHDPGSCYFSDLERWLRDLIGCNVKPDVIIIDTIQSMLGDGKGPRWGDYELMMIQLERLAKDMNAVLIITAQQNNDAIKDNRSVVKQSDVGGSIAIVQKCSVIMVLTPMRDINKDESIDESLMGIQIIKNRITGNGVVHDPPMIRYIDEYKSYVEVEDVDLDLYNNDLSLQDLISESEFVI